MIIDQLYKRFKEQQKIREVFKAGGIYLKNEQGTMYPKIETIKVTDEYIRYTFTLPNGIDLALVKDNEWRFKQVFGSSVTLESKTNKFALTLFNN